MDRYTKAPFFNTTLHISPNLFVAGKLLGYGAGAIRPVSLDLV